MNKYLDYDPVDQEDAFHALVPIRHSYIQPFKLGEGLAALKIMSYYGTGAEVCQLYQLLNHDSRAYCVNDVDVSGLSKYPKHFAHLSAKAKQVIV